MVMMSSEYSIYLYREKVDLRKGISGLSGIVRDEMRLNPNTAKSVYVFSDRTPPHKEDPGPRAQPLRADADPS